MTKNDVRCRGSLYLQSKIPPHGKYGRLSQLQRAIISASLNIAEGSADNSNKGFHRYLKIAHGSLYESVTGLLLIKRIYQVNIAKALKVYNNTGRLLNGLIKFLKADSQKLEANLER